jgi:hypothetical protein
MRKVPVEIVIVSIGAVSYTLTRTDRFRVHAECATVGDPRQAKKPGERRTRSF